MTIEREPIEPSNNEERLLWKTLDALIHKFTTKNHARSFQVLFNSVFMFALKQLGMRVSTSKTLSDFDDMRRRAYDKFKGSNG